MGEPEKEAAWSIADQDDKSSLLSASSSGL
jgi:hypothetical protein